jgi:hypothetical protein
MTLARNPLAIAGFRAAFLSAGAGVVVVEATIATGRHADVGTAAAPAAQQAGEQEVAALSDALGAVLAALLEQLLCALEHVGIHEAGVLAVEALATPVDAADVGLVAQDQQHHGRLPALPATRRRVFGVEQPSDRDGAVSAGGVKVEDPADDRRLPLLLHQLLLLVAAVAVRHTTVRPVALFRASLMPAVMRSTIVACSNSAKTPSICNIIRPAAEPVSNGSVAERSTTSRRSSSSASWES